MCAGPPARLTERRNPWIDAFQHQRPVDQREQRERKRRDAGDQQQRRIIECKH
jgi:hypothetical protein